MQHLCMPYGGLFDQLNDSAKLINSFFDLKSAQKTERLISQKNYYDLWAAVKIIKILHCFFLSKLFGRYQCDISVWKSFQMCPKCMGFLLWEWKESIQLKSEIFNRIDHSCLTSNLIHIARYHYATYFENLSWNHGRGFFTVKRISRGITMMNLFVFFSSYLMSHSFVASLQTFFVIIILLSSV